MSEKNRNFCNVSQQVLSKVVAGPSKPYVSLSTRLHFFNLKFCKDFFLILSESLQTPLTKTYALTLSPRATLEVMLHGTIRNDDFNATLRRNIRTML